VKDHRPRFYFSLRSPYSWLALEDLTTRHPGLVPILDWRPYWEPDEQTEAMLAEAGGKVRYPEMPRAKHLYILQDVRRLTRARSLPVTWPVDRNPWWEVPHLACLAADRAGRLADLAIALTRARWREGADICDPAAVAAVADRLGLDGAEIGRAAHDPDLRKAGTAVLLDADRDGVFGVPFFVQGTSRFWGMDRLDAFASWLAERRPDEPLAVPAAGYGTTDQGHAGGCG
jgi:2-hydroxychromene-2-carboxylate isomerase